MIFFRESISVCGTILLLSYLLTEENAQNYFHDRVARGSKAKATAKVNLSRSENATYVTDQPLCRVRVAAILRRKHAKPRAHLFMQVAYNALSYGCHEWLAREQKIDYMFHDSTSLSNNPRTRDGNPMILERDGQRVFESRVKSALKNIEE